MNPIVSNKQWLADRKKLLELEKEFTRKRDELSRLRQKLPWRRIDKEYRFDGPDGEETLSDLFGECSQLIVYHFMMGDDWEQGCKSCSFLADHYEPAIIHLKQRDVNMVTVSSASQKKVAEFQNRMGWKFKWVSALDDFNRDFHVTFTQEELDTGEVEYNYTNGSFPMREAPGLSVFAKSDSGELFHTYSTYARGLDMFITAYHLLDVVPKGRDEEGLPYTMSWVRHHDRYEDGSADMYAGLERD